MTYDYMDKNARAWTDARRNRALSHMCALLKNSTGKPSPPHYSHE